MSMLIVTWSTRNETERIVGGEEKTFRSAETAGNTTATIVRFVQTTIAIAQRTDSLGFTKLSGTKRTCGTAQTITGIASTTLPAPQTTSTEASCAHLVIRRI